MKDIKKLNSNLEKRIHVVFVRYGIRGLDGIVRDLKQDVSGVLKIVDKEGIEIDGEFPNNQPSPSRAFYYSLPFKSNNIKIERIYVEDELANGQKKLIYGDSPVCQHLEFLKNRKKKSIPDDLEDDDKAFAEYKCKISGEPCVGNMKDDYKDGHGGPISQAKYSSNLAMTCGNFALKRKDGVKK